MSHPIICVPVGIYVIDILAICFFGKKWVWSKESDIMVDSSGE
jgi:hypothetical protein